MSPQLQHFLKIAKRGAFPGASGGERRAHKLAMAILENAQGLDGDAIDGFAELLRISMHSPCEARDLVEVGGGS